jgi:starch-binding outer membrane protein, SusD/RagB family
MKSNQIRNIAILGILISTMLGCSKLDEKLNSALTFDQAKALTSAAPLLRSTYNSMQEALTSQDRFIALQEHPSDAMIGPTRATDWDDNGVWRVLHQHTWDADHAYITRSFENLLIMQYNATNVLNFNPTPAIAAEARFLRAFSMWAVLDGWNVVPYRTAGSNLADPPIVLKGKQALDSIISELNAIIPDLTNGPKNRANKNAARFLLMKCYLNKAVYTGDRKTITFDNADMAQVVSLADQITGYAVSPNYFSNFDANNTTSTESIFTYGGGTSENQGRQGNNVRSRWHMSMHYNQNPGGWNGFATLADFYDKFEATDKRRAAVYPSTAYTNSGNRINAGFLIGQQYNLSTDVPLKDTRGNNLIFSRNVATNLQESSPATLEITGIRVVKYTPDYANDDAPANEFVFFRYSDVLLMKAEALLRSGGAGGLAIVNNLRLTRGVPALASLTTSNMLDERGRELYWEGWRRNDQIRFGTFLAANQYKPSVSPDKCLLFPIPNNDLAANPSLQQNPGY